MLNVISIRGRGKPFLLKIVAVSARQLDSAKEFAAKYGASKAYGSYKELIEDPNVGKEIFPLSVANAPVLLIL